MDAKLKPNNNLAEAVIQVNNNLNAEDLIKGVLIGNECTLDMNIQKHGEDIQFGTFSNGLASVGFDSGVIISTGHINNAPGPNNSGGKGTNVPGDYQDNDLAQIVTEDTHDAAVIEFDFTPVTDQISFEYVFASEEYCEFVNDDYNDVFGFFISGPGINGTLNIARIPGSGEVVS
ncbi:MAG: choice-of-anchor L domain-containing protein, partial [Bacteroidales bacterium]|nr:choice-of-anchor L domain-containing protein [Bacteroidales bacterium]